jgi:hypothetical protein
VLSLAGAVEGDEATLVGLVGLAITGVGAAQLVPGALLIHRGHENRARYDVALGSEAHDAGFLTGLGRGLVAYGVVILIPCVVSLAGDGLDDPASAAYLVAGPLVGGGYAWYSGSQDFERLRAQPTPPPQVGRELPAPRILPVVRLSF